MKELKIELMEERRHKVSRQTEIKRKEKEDLDTKLQEYGGLWKTSYKMNFRSNHTLDQVPALMRKNAVIAQIK